MIMINSIICKGWGEHVVLYLCCSYSLSDGYSVHETDAHRTRVAVDLRCSASLRGQQTSPPERGSSQDHEACETCHGTRYRHTLIPFFFHAGLAVNGQGSHYIHSDTLGLSIGPLRRLRYLLFSAADFTLNRPQCGVMAFCCSRFVKRRYHWDLMPLCSNLLGYIGSGTGACRTDGPDTLETPDNFTTTVTEATP